MLAVVYTFFLTSIIMFNHTKVIDSKSNTMDRLIKPKETAHIRTKNQLSLGRRATAYTVPVAVLILKSSKIDDFHLI